MTRDAHDTAILVAPDVVTERLLPTFLAHRQRDVAVIIDMLGRQGFGEIQELGHNLKGVGRSYGCDGISDIGRALEEAAKHRDVTGIRERAVELGNYLRRVRIGRAESDAS